MSSRTLAYFFRRSIGLAVRYFASHSGHVQAPHPQLPMHRARKRVALLLLSLGLGVAGVFGGIYCFDWWMDGGNLEAVPLPPGRTASSVSDDEPLEVYTFGVVPQFDTRQLVSVWLPLLKQVEMRAGCRLEFKGTKDIPTFELEFEKGNFDFAYMNPYHSTVAWKTQKYWVSSTLFRGIRTMFLRFTTLLFSVCRSCPITSNHKQSTSHSSDNSIFMSLKE